MSESEPVDSNSQAGAIDPQIPIPTCPNCRTPKPDTDRFCRQCGQRHTRLNDGLYYFVSDFVTSFLSVDGRAFRTLTTLLFRPGKCSLDFLWGRRNAYLSTAQTYLVSGFFFFLIFGSWINILKIEDLLTVNLGEDRVSIADLNRETFTPKNDESVGLPFLSLSGSEAVRTPSDTDQVPAGHGKVEETPAQESGEPKETESLQSSSDSRSDERTLNPESFRNKVHTINFSGKPVQVSWAEFRQFSMLPDDAIRKFFLEQDVELDAWEVDILKRGALLTTDHGFASYVSGSVTLASQLALLMLPLLAILLRMFHWRSCPTWLAAFVVSAHWHASMYLALSILMLLNLGLLWLGLAGGVIGAIYWFATLRRVFGQSWLVILVKTFFIVPMYGFGLLIGFSTAILGSIFLF
jgi:hypothetical protein